MEGGGGRGGLECAVKTDRNIFKDKLTKQITKKDTEGRQKRRRHLPDGLGLSE